MRAVKFAAGGLMVAAVGCAAFGAGLIWLDRWKAYRRWQATEREPGRG